MRMSHPLPNAWPVHPLHGSRSRPLFPDRLQSKKFYPILQKFRLSAAVASASARMGRTVQTAWTRCDSAIATTGGHPPASGPARSARSNSTTAQVKSNETRAGGRPCHRSAGPIHEGAMLSHARGPLKHKRSVRGLFFAHFLIKKRPKNRLRYVTASQ